MALTAFTHSIYTKADQKLHNTLYSTIELNRPTK